MDCDIELEIGTGSTRGEYTVHVVRAPAGGHASGRFTLDIDGIQGRLPQLEATVLASAVAARRTLPVAEVAVREVGQQLFQALFTREVYGTYRASLGAAQHAGQQLRVVLRLAAPELATMPWETLFDPETETYLCQTEPLLRHIPAPDYNQNPLDVAPPLRILGIVASPRDLPALDVQAEKDHLAQALAGPGDEGRVELVWTRSGTWDDVQSMLLAGPWHVVHFVGHGDYDSRTDEGRIALVGNDGRAAMVRAVRLMALLSVAAPRPRLVVLNSCSSGEMGQTDLFSGTASALVRSGIGAVAAMQFAISDSAAIAFAHGFYAAIANGRTVDEAARIGRISVMASPDGTLEWVTPALYVRGGSTQLFSLQGTPSGRPPAERTTPTRASGGQSASVSSAYTAIPHESVLPADSPGPATTKPLPESETARATTSGTDLDQVRRRAQLRALYVEASAELRAKHYEQALESFNDLLTLEPGYRDAVALRDTASRRLTEERAYRDATAAEESGDWIAAAEGFAKLLDSPQYPDAARRKEGCERKQRISDLQGELRYHHSKGSWEAVIDVAKELRTLDPGAADPDGLTTAAKAELSKAAPESAAEDIADEERGSYTASDLPALKRQAGAQPKEKAPGLVPPSGPDEPVWKPARRPHLPLAGATIAWAGATLATAGGVGAGFVVFFMWFDQNYWQDNGGDIVLRIVYGVVTAFGYLLLVIAGLPDRSAQGRLAMTCLVVSQGVFGLAGLNYTVEVAAVIGSFAVAGSGLWAGVLAMKYPAQQTMAWLLLLPTVLLPIIWIQGKGVFLVSWYMSQALPLLLHLILLCGAGIAFLVTAQRTASVGGVGMVIKDAS
ncbi:MULTISPECIES: CHAT domain-containing protein [Paenarthrobacter]|uniref:CHAT domain-containing protein n=1 Tax=Paenarthrobacter TaxID=1742992 RepID=UPI00074D2957|nr:CHAT domain-containing protein [Paenarthrobacter ureafaciens]AMB42219.1 hypothetical protein AUT26_19850 [Arthrobacter sp. ATCC 21022]KUR65128.1 hypothetical protein JM67_06740 [Arthrobacter sp. ATCC 21022]RWW94907.1 CHAT domain-containing protein [Paenarthrobacter ureafaciens]